MTEKKLYCIEITRTAETYDETLALRHLSAIQGSWDPKHEYKEAAVAFLASLWLEEWN